MSGAAPSYHPASVPSMSFTFNGHDVSVVVDENGEIWFVAKEICEILELSHNQAVHRLDDDEKGVRIADTPGGPQQVSVISESGFYSLVMRSRKPQARPFRRWATHDVIQSIRKTGRYESPGAAPSSPLSSSSRPVQLMEDTITRALDAGVTDECLARLTAARLELALGRTPELPPLEFKPKALPARSSSPGLRVGFEGLASAPQHMVCVSLARPVLDRLIAGDSATKAFVRAALNDCVDHPGEDMRVVH